MPECPRCDAPVTDPDWAPYCSSLCLISPEDPPPPWVHEHVMGAVRDALQRRREEIAELERMWQADPGE
ncbi:hypothetical protein [Planomonospora parontospora]|uniref:hypothetical protein n=1 Tax=Planomonospora parontospora TaxID=58119 RepID=UPI001670EDF1|nr:hypothetical protein [Planomonospora parontospora]GGL56665.1 hypothetical protein GCM10014719_67610 [Planomonospora parontospora subsp. antibiotica]GII19951.1 hypothetical protein Ppa05_66770 [Planomonospora parontospora subsp. antibiotica]